MTKPLPRPQTPEPIVVTPLVAGALLSLGQTRLYELIDSGELESFKAGRSRRITMKSITAYIERQLAAEPRKEKS
jgi:excisionase family DNA binding protein